MENEIVKRLVWSGLLAGLGALASIATTRLAGHRSGAASSRRIRPSERRTPHSPTAAGRRPRQRTVACGQRHARAAPPASARRPTEHPEIVVGAAFAGGLVARPDPQAPWPERLTTDHSAAKAIAEADHRGLRARLAARPRGDRARQGRGHREGHQARSRARRSASPPACSSIFGRAVPLHGLAWLAYWSLPVGDKPVLLGLLRRRRDPVRARRPRRALAAKLVKAARRRCRRWRSRRPSRSARPSSLRAP